MLLSMISRGACQVAGGIFICKPAIQNIIAKALLPLRYKKMKKILLFYRNTLHSNDKILLTVNFDKPGCEKSLYLNSRYGRLTSILKFPLRV